ncbi:MAG: transglutaminase domain-containing protein [Myxococcales bacterium]|nr:transglutaminase domain-containing protein [Myxococcales bacterium]
MIRKLINGWRHPLRLFAMGLAAFSLAWGVALTEGLVAAVLGAWLGVLAGELAGRSRLRLGAAVAGFGLVWGAAWGLASLVTTTEFLAEALGPANALVAAAVLRFGAVAVASVGTLRAVAVRRPSMLALELAAIAGAFATVFSAHREGVIARPLWLSDWAWQQGIDPAQALMAVGAGSVILLAVLLVAETRSGRALSALVSLLVLSGVAFLFIGVVGTPSPGPMGELGLTDAGMGQPPRRTDGGNAPNENEGDGGRGRGQEGDGGTGGHGGDAGDGGAGGGLDGSLDGGTGGGLDGSVDGGGSAGGDGGDGSASGQSDGGDGGAGGGDGGDVPFPNLVPTDGSVGNAPPPQDAGRILPSSEQLSESQSPTNSPAPMAVVLLNDDYSPPSGAYYFRQEVWSQYNGTRLVSTPRSDVDLDVMDEFPTYDVAVRDVPTLNGRTRVSGLVALITEHAHPFALESPAAYGPAQNPNPQRFLRAWRFSSNAQTVDYRQLIGRAAGDRRWSPEVREYFTRGPTDRRYVELARRIVRERLPERLRRDPFAQALAVKMWLDHELIYSTHPRYRHANVPDPTADFLWGNRTGYCVHFAHSAVFLWRALGIPSRISTGYHSDESNRRGGSTILLRGGDAHAWPELYVEGYGWIVLDIAAERNLDPTGSPPDEDLQRILGEMARQSPPDPREPPPRPNQPRVEHHYARNLGYGLVALLALTTLALYAVKLWRRAVPAFAKGHDLARVAYRRCLDQLAECGYQREFGESRERFAARVSAQVPSFAKITDLHLRSAYRPRDLADERVEHSREAWGAALAQFKKELPGAARRWRRALGLVHPGSWLDAR